MTETAVLEKAEKRKKGTACEPARAMIAQEPAEPLVRTPHRSASSLVRASRRTMGTVAHHLANAAWHTFQMANRLVPYGRIQPRWAPAPLLKSRERSLPPLGFPRETDSLCPKCVLEVRSAILQGREDWQVLIQGKPGEIKARIVEKDNKIYMEKDCPRHGHFQDLMAIDARFLRRMEKLYPGRDFRMAKDNLHNHGTSSIQFGRGAVLTVDLTNRCNMMCNPCFMDANQVGYVHELTWEDIREILDNAISIKPRRQLSVQFSGGEPTISPYFLDAVAYAKNLGYQSTQCATNGIRFAQEPDFARKAKQAGLRLAYLQFDGVGNENHAHRKVGNLFDVKLRALENLKAAGVDVTLVVTVVNTVNNHQVGPIVKFAIENIDKINAVSFQPVSFTGRDDEIPDEDRYRQRYTLSHLAHDVKSQLGITEPMRDWFPLSASGPFSDLKDQLDGVEAQFGSLKCGCHPNCGIGTMLLVNQETKEAMPIPQLINTDQLLEDLKVVNDTSRSRFLTVAQVALAVLRNYRFEESPEGLGFWQTLKIIDGHNGGRLNLAERPRYNWRIMMVAGMWFQDLFNYDFRRTEMCIIPYATQMGEISFCAYNTGVGWRQIVERVHQTATTAEWFAKKGRHAIYAGGRSVPLPAMSESATGGSLPTPTSVSIPGLKILSEPSQGTRASAGGGCGCH
ncbi:MAG TPA: radical SAM protein [Candidatus Polarisedimenticolia bacterium]|nr:radical SAM protein [Candidatus Polarisedimenticolia bacterium]